MKPVDMSAAAISRRLIRQSQLREFCIGLAGPRRRPLSSLGPLTLLDENGNPSGEPIVLRETPPPYRTETPKQ